MTYRQLFTLSGFWLLGMTASQPVWAAEGRPADTKVASTDPELEQLRASAAAFETAFNAGDAKALGAMFIDKAEVVDADGGVISGREAIQARFAGLFQETPGCTVQVEITSLRQLTPAVALEEGMTKITLPKDKGTSVNSYTLIHLKQDGKWRFASIRDYPDLVTDTPHEHLKSLEWIVGEWIDESDDGHVHTTYKWSEDGNYLVSGYLVKTKSGSELKGTQRIAWDPLRRTIRGWVFDEHGGFMESEWVPAADSWVVKAQGFTPDGQPVSTTRLITPLSKDVYQIHSTARAVGGAILPDTSVRVVRRPPAPGAGRAQRRVDHRRGR